MQSRVHILHLEDNPADGELVQAMLAEDGLACEIVRVETRAAFSDALDRQRFDLMVSDFTLPSYDGRSALLLAKAKYPDMPVLFFSGTLGEESAIQSLRDGAADYILKQRPARFAQAVRRALRDAEEKASSRQFEKTMRESQERFIGFFESSKDGIAYSTLDGLLLDVNDSLLKLTGHTKEDLLAKTYQELTPTEYRNFEADIVTKVIRNGEPAEYEKELLRKDGSRVAISETVFVVKNRDGRPGGLAAIIKDITERKQAEATIRQREQQYASLLHTIDGIVWEADAVTFRFTFVSHQAERILGYPADQWLSDPSFLATHLHPEDREHSVAYCAEQVNLRKHHDCEYRMIAADGRTVWLRDIVSVHVDREDNVRLRGIMVNITERKQAEHNLVVSERRYRRLFETAKDGILILDYETGQITDVNPFLTTMLGFSREEMLGKTLWDIGFARDVAESKLNFDDLKREGYVRYEDLPLETKDHRTFLVEFISNVYLVDTQNVIQCNIRDITERKQMERRAARLEELATLGQLMSGIAHELKNPLFVLSGRLQLVSEKLASREYDTVGTDFKKIEDAAQRMTTVTQRFLNFAKPHIAQKERCAINLALQKTMDFLSNELMKNRIQLVKSLSPNLQPVWCDPRDLQQVFTNLILNAIYAMAKANGRGTLTISTVPSEAAVETRIQDDGAGIAPEHRAKLFDPFYTTKPVGEGTGLGLWIAKSSIIGMRGTIDYETEVGKGSTFIIRLPAMPAQESS